MGKKKFFDKKKSATFQLMARDTSDPNYSSDPSGDRVFIRVDNNQYTPSFEDQLGDCDLSADPDSIYADAPEDCDGENAGDGFGELGVLKSNSSALPDHIRREMLELGFPDDGYNYLAHLREIKNTGGGSTYFHNPKADFLKPPQDVKAYDASRVEVSEINDAAERSMYSVASKTVGVRLQKVLDPEIAAMLDDSNSSNFESDVEDLEEDFVVKANLFEGREGDEHDEKLIGEKIVKKSIGEEHNEKSSFTAGSSLHRLSAQDSVISGSSVKASSASCLADEKPRARRPLDEQFDMLELHEYGDESEEEFMGYMDEEECQESLAGKLNSGLKDYSPNVLHLKNEANDDKPPELTPDVILRCKEYAEKYVDEDDNTEVVLVEESSDESEVWDCETIITTYSTLDNHPGKIGAPEARRKKKLAEALAGSAAGTNQVITLRGKERLPVDFLPGNRKRDEEKTKDANSKKTEIQKKPRAEESKEEKKERKSAVKLERREARQMKKEMKVVYKSEGQRAQKVAAFTGPSSIHLM